MTLLAGSRFAARLARLAGSSAARVAGAAACGTAGVFAFGSLRPAEAEPYAGPKETHLRETAYAIPEHYHGKWKVRVLKVRRPPPGVEARHEINEYCVRVSLWSPEYEKVYLENDNADLVATDTCKNTVYVVAKRTAAETPEQFGIDIATHFMTEYPFLSKCKIEVDEKPWMRAIVNGEEHDHSFILGPAEYARAVVDVSRDAKGKLCRPNVLSSLVNMTILKTTQSGFEGYLHDKYTLLPDTQERCLATELCADWTYMRSDPPPDYATVRKAVREQLKYGIFGPARGGIYSASLQATIYDAGCLVLDAAPHIKDLQLFTPNLHYLPAALLERLGEKFEDDIFVPISEPSGTISCVVSRKNI
jgi:urate oxidase